MRDDDQRAGRQSAQDELAARNDDVEQRFVRLIDLSEEPAPAPVLRDLLGRGQRRLGD